MAISDDVAEVGKGTLIATGTNGWFSPDRGAPLRGCAVDLRSGSIFCINVLWIAIESRSLNGQSIVAASVDASGTS